MLTQSNDLPCGKTPLLDGKDLFCKCGEYYSSQKEYSAYADNLHASPQSAFQNIAGENKESKEANLDTAGTIKGNSMAARRKELQRKKKRTEIHYIMCSGLYSTWQYKDKENPFPWHKIKHLKPKRGDDKE